MADKMNPLGGDKGMEQLFGRPHSYPNKTNRDADALLKSNVIDIPASMRAIDDMMGYLSKQSKKNKVQLTLNTKDLENAFDTGSSQIGQAFKSAGKQLVGIFTREMKNGLQGYLTAFETHYTSISQRLNVTVGSYNKLQSKMVDQVRAYNLSNVIATKELVTKLDAAAKQGFLGDVAAKKAFADALAEAITPVLNTTTAEFNDLYSTYGDSFQSALVGITQAEIAAGRGRFTNEDGLNRIVSQLSAGLKSYDEATSVKMISDITARAGVMREAGVSQGTVSNFISMISKVMNNPNQAIINGTHMERVLASSYMSGGEGTSGLASLLAAYDQQIAQAAANGSKTGRGVYGDVLGLGISSVGDYDKISRAFGVTGVGYEEALGLSEDAAKNAAEHKTISQKIETWLGNVATNWGGWLKSLPQGMSTLDVIANLVNKMYQLQWAQMGGKLLSGGGRAIGGLMRAGGGTVLAGAGVAGAILGTTAGIISVIENARNAADEDQAENFPTTGYTVTKRRSSIFSDRDVKTDRGFIEGLGSGRTGDRTIMLPYQYADGAPIKYKNIGAEPIEETVDYLKYYVMDTQGMATTYVVDKKAKTANNYPEHKFGGLFTSPHLGLVAEAGTESIIPITRPAIAAPILNQTAGMLGKTVYDSGEIPELLQAISGSSGNNADVVDAIHWLAGRLEAILSNQKTNTTTRDTKTIGYNDNISSFKSRF